MDNQIFKDENKNFEFDFSKGKLAYEIHDDLKNTILSDVDFIVEDEEKILLIEYKNSDIPDVKNPDEMIKKIKTGEFYTKIARKYYDSIFYMWACDKNNQNKPIEYILLIEHKEIDSVIRKQLIAKIMKQLPFKLQNSPNVKKNIIKRFLVLNLQEWHEKYSEFPITPVM